MQTGVISFCDRINYNIKSTEVKEQILQELGRRHGIQVLQRHWFHLDDKGYEHMARNQHAVCLRSNGNPYYMCFMKYEDVPIVYFIDKKVQPGYQQPRILLGRGLWDASLFSNTIFDGEMVKDKYGGWMFLINDVLAYQGKYVHTMDLSRRLEIAFDILKTKHTRDPLVDCCSYQVKQYATPTKEGVDALLDLSQRLPYTSRGLYFWPYASKAKPKLVNFDDNLIKSVIRKVKDVPDFKLVGERAGAGADAPSAAALPAAVEAASAASPAISVVSQPPTTAAAAATDGQEQAQGQACWMRKTDLPDIYEVFNDAAGFRGERNGLALVPNMATSKLMRSIFKDTTVAMHVKMLARFVEAQNKWLPICKAA